MSATISLTNADAWIARVYEWSRHVERDLAEVVREEVREVLRMAMKFTPPKSLSQGRTAVRRDILRTMRPLNPSDITGSTRGAKELRRVIAAKDAAAFNRLTPFLGKGSPLLKAVAADFDPELHRSRRDFRMRVDGGSRGRARQTTVLMGRKNAGALTRYIRTIQSHVGFAKAGWWPALRVAGGTASEWITRHGEAAGGAFDGIKTAGGNAKEMFIVVLNRTGWGAREGRRILDDALRVRSNIMRRKMSEALKSGGAPLVAKG